MDRNTITGLVVIFAILIGYSILSTPSKKTREEMKRKQDSIASIVRAKDSLNRINAAKIADTVANKPQDEKPDSIVSSVDTAVSAFSNPGKRDQIVYHIESDVLDLGISSLGGKIIHAQIKDFHTYDSFPLILFDTSSVNFGLKFFTKNRLINTNEMVFIPFLNGIPFNKAGPVELNDKDSLVFSMRLFAAKADTTAENENYIEFEYILKKGSYMVGFNIRFNKMNSVIDQGTSFVDLMWSADLRMLEKAKDQFDGPTIYYQHLQDEEVDYMNETKDDEESLKTNIKWISFKQRFFSSTLIAGESFENAELKVTTKEKKDPKYLRTMSSTIGLPYQSAETQDIAMRFYFGPNKFNLLRKYDLGLERQIPIGWSFFLMAWINRYAVLPVFTFLGNLGWNYGIIILILTILLKIVLLPIAYKSYVSSAKMKILKPDIDELNQKFTKKDDAMKKQQATMALYKSAGVNPMAGCIPMLLQLPILIAMFRFFPSSFELRQQPFLWADDLSSYDSIFSLPFNIPFYGEHVSLFTLLMTISTIIYTKINNDLMAGSSSTQMPGMKTMMYIMPIMFLGIFNNYAAGLSYYYLCANVLTFGQMYIIRKMINEEKLHLQIQENKKRPVKKSGFQKRLEDMAKQRGYKMPKK